MRLSPVERTKVFRIPGILRFTKVEVLPYMDLRGTESGRPGGLVRGYTKSVELKTEEILGKLVCDPMAVCTLLTVL